MSKMLCAQPSVNGVPRRSNAIAACSACDFVSAASKKFKFCRMRPLRCPPCLRCLSGFRRNVDVFEIGAYPLCRAGSQRADHKLTRQPSRLVARVDRPLLMYSMPRPERQPSCRYEVRLCVMAHGLAHSGFILCSLIAASLVALLFDLCWPSVLASPRRRIGFPHLSN